MIIQFKNFNLLNNMRKNMNLKLPQLPLHYNMICLKHLNLLLELLIAILHCPALPLHPLHIPHHPSQLIPQLTNLPPQLLIPNFQFTINPIEFHLFISLNLNSLIQSLILLFKKFALLFQLAMIGLD